MLSRVQLFATPWTIAGQAPLSKGFSRQEYWSRLPCLPPCDHPDPGIKPTSPVSPALAGEFFTTEPPGKSKYCNKTHASEKAGLKIKLCEIQRSFVTWLRNRLKWTSPGDPTPRPRSIQALLLFGSMWWQFSSGLSITLSLHLVPCLGWNV